MKRTFHRFAPNEKLVSDGKVAENYGRKGDYDHIRYRRKPKERVDMKKNEIVGGLNRRHFIQGAAGALGGLFLWGLPVLERSAAADANYWGVDSGTPLANAENNGLPIQFYIGALGAGIPDYLESGSFATDSAQQVGSNYTHGWWGLAGPDSHTDNPYAYGYSQGEAAVNAQKGNGLVGGLTIFADIEVGFGDWGNSSTDDNASVLDGFLQAVSDAGLTPGVYMNDTTQGKLFSHYSSSIPFVYWYAGGPYAITGSSPCNVSINPQPVLNNLNSVVQNETFGGQQVVLWQYWTSDDNSCPANFNISLQSGYQVFFPVAQQTSWWSWW